MSPGAGLDDRVTVRAFVERDREQLLRLHASEWKSLYGKRYEQVLDIQRPLMVESNIAVADRDGTVIGYGQFFQFHQRLNMKGYVNLRARAARGELTARLRLKGYLARKGLRYRIFKRPVLGSLSEHAVPLPDELDAYMLDLVVHPDHRGRRIGTRLTEKRLQMAKDQGARRAYVNCKEGSPSGKIYQRLGFRPFLFEQPYVPDGTGSTCMYREL